MNAGKLWNNLRSSVGATGQAGKIAFADSAKPVAEVAASVGFARQNHFSQVFKKQTGLSLNEFRRRS